jgi:hypothetical protein
MLRPLPRTYNPATVAALNQAFDEVWRHLYSNVSKHDEIMVKDLSITLSQTLADLVSNSVTDVRTLRRRALENMVLSAR